MKVIFLGYREWALKTIDKVRFHSSIRESLVYTQGDEFLRFLADIDNPADNDWIIIVIGWSQILPEYIVKHFLCLGLHPSDLPNYKGGSPLQHQIIDGVINTQMSLFRLTAKLDSGEIWGKSDLCLAGDSMCLIFENLITASCNVLNTFFNNYPNINKCEQGPVSKTLKRRSPEDSKLEFTDFEASNLINIYNKIRCLTDPYPNAYLEDEDGNRLFFKQISFKAAAK